MVFYITHVTEYMLHVLNCFQELVCPLHVSEYMLQTLELSLHHDKNPKSRRQCLKSIHNIIGFLQNNW